ncbi:MAG TPA: FlgD immunoglobulin-like domain containing protein [Gemmatimonadales bacterium]|nr:FlgD immunoglobulin-like domain containing protein [Gemmatimonadales bacterium]
MRRAALFVLAGLSAAGVAAAQGTAPQNATLRRAVQAAENLNLPQAITLANQALGQHMNATDQERAYSLLGDAYSNQPDGFDKAMNAFRQVLLINPERQLDPNRTATKTLVAFNMALSTMLLVRGVTVDSSSFVVGQGAVPIHFTVTSPARVHIKAVSAKTTVNIDSSIANGTVNVRWNGTLPNGDPVPAGDYTIVVDAAAEQNTFSAGARVHVSAGTVDTLAHLTSMPGYSKLPDMEVPPRSWRPLGVSFLYAGIAGAGTLALENSQLGSANRRELSLVAVGVLATGVVMMLKKPSPVPAQGNILYNKLLDEQLIRRNADIAQQNVTLRRQVRLTVAPAAVTK